MKQALALAFALMCSVAGRALAEDKAAPAGPAAGEVKGTVRYVEPNQHAIVLEDGTRLSVSDKQIDTIWAGDQVKAGYVKLPDGSLAITGMEVDRFSNQESE